MLTKELRYNCNFSLINKVKDDPSSVEHFFDLVLDSHIVAAALVLFGMDDVKSQPTQNVDLAKLETDKWGYLSQVLHQFIPFVQQPIFVTDDVIPIKKIKKGCFQSCTRYPPIAEPKLKKGGSNVV